MAIVTLLMVGSLAFLAVIMIRSIASHRVRGRSLWREFGLSLSLVTLFLISWVGQGIAEWQAYTDDQREHGQPVEAGDFFTAFAQSTLENWQSEFLQLFSFVVLAALYIHRGSAESKDSDEKLEASLHRIEEKLGTLPKEKKGRSESWELPDPVVSS